MANVNLETKRHEEEVEKFLTNLGFTMNCSGKRILGFNDNEIGEIDSLYEYKDYLLIIEVSTKKKHDNQKKNFFFSKWSDGFNLRKLRDQCNVNKKKTIRVYFDKVTKEPENHLGLDHITLRRKGNKVVYADKYEEFLKDLKKNPSLHHLFHILCFVKWIQQNVFHL